MSRPNPSFPRFTQPLSDRCRGRWYNILRALGIEACVLNRRNQPCPMCGGKDRFRWTNHNDGGGYFCNGCGSGDGITFVQELFGVDFKGAASMIEGVIGKAELDTHPSRDERELKEAMKSVWMSGQRIVDGDAVGLYLRSRGLNLSSYPTALRYVPSLRHDEGMAPAMIAQIVSPEGKAANIHRTWLTDDGQKAPLSVCRKVMAGSIPDGSAIRLDVAGPVLGIAEGIETALWARQRFGVPVWATISEGGMQKFRPPACVQRLIIFGDNDLSFVGQAAAYATARDVLRWSQREGRMIDVQVKIPGVAGTDWADAPSATVAALSITERGAA